MDTPKTTIAKLLRRIEREMQSFTHVGRQQKCAHWLIEELNELEAGLLQMAGPKSVESVLLGAEQPGGEGVAGEPRRSEWDCSSASAKNPQLESGDVWKIKGCARGPEAEVIMPMINQEAKIYLSEMQDPASFRGDEAPIFQTDSQCTVSADAFAKELVSVMGGEAGAGEIVALEVKEVPRWPAESEVTIFGYVPNPTLMAVTLRDGRRVSFLKESGKSDYRRGAVIKARLSSRGSLGNPIYEVAQ